VSLWQLSRRPEQRGVVRYLILTRGRQPARLLSLSDLCFLRPAPRLGAGVAAPLQFVEAVAQWVIPLYAANWASGHHGHPPTAGTSSRTSTMAARVIARRASRCSRPGMMDTGWPCTPPAIVRISEYSR
jgi:hypothetical protein